MMPPRPGDVILYPITPRSGWTSRFVGAAELAVGVGQGAVQYSHAAIMSEKTGWQYEAKWPRVGHYPIDARRIAEVWNLGHPTHDQRVQILAYCREHEGDWYNMLGLLTGGLLGLPRTEVCSQLVGDAYATARPPIRIGKEGQRLLSPNALRDLSTATYLGRFMPRYGWQAARKGD